jgi:hypothetical protein
MNDMLDVKDEAAVTQENTNHDIGKCLHVKADAPAQALMEA